MHAAPFSILHSKFELLHSAFRPRKGEARVELNYAAISSDTAAALVTDASGIAS